MLQSLKMQWLASFTAIALSLSLLAPGLIIAAEENLFADGFETGNPDRWSIHDGWDVVGADAASGTYKGRVAGETFNREDEEDEDRFPQLVQYESTEGYEDLVLSFHYKTTDFEPDDELKVQFMTEEGGEWEDLETFTDGDEQLEWTSTSLPLPGTADDNEHFAFRFISYLDSENDLFHLDEVHLSGEAIESEDDEEEDESDYPYVYEANLRGDEEVPPVETEATGEIEVAFTKSGDEARFELEIENGLNLTQAHLHCAPDGQNGPVVVTLFEDQSGKDLVDGVLVTGTITAADIEGTGEDCEAAVNNIADLQDAIDNGLIYVNVHSERYPAGEIRGQLVAEDEDEEEEEEDEEDEDEEDEEDEEDDELSGKIQAITAYVWDNETGVEIDTEETFEWLGLDTTDEDEIIEEVADFLNISEEAVEELISFE